MFPGHGIRMPLAVAVLFTVAAGDFWRNLIGWWGWAALCLVLATAALVLLVRIPGWWRAIPPTLAAFLLLATLSLAWSQYPSGTLIGIAGTLATAAGGVFVAVALDRRGFLEALSRALRLVLALSLVFELIVAAIVRAPATALFPAFEPSGDLPDAYYWSRALLFEGGRIQGIVGNANLLGFLALVAVVVLVIQWRTRPDRRVQLVVWLAVAVAVLLLTRSATVLAAGAAVVAAGVLLVLARRSEVVGRRVVYVVAALGFVTAVLVAALAPEVVFGALGRSDSATNRVEIWDAVVGLAQQRPWFGWGWVSYWVPWLEPFDDLAVFNGVTYLQAHDAWLDVWFQLGIVGLVVFGALVTVTLVRSWWQATSDRRLAPRHSVRADAATVAAPLLLVALLVQSVAESRLLVEFGFTLLVIIAVQARRLRASRPAGSEIRA